MNSNQEAGKTVEKPADRWRQAWEAEIGAPEIYMRLLTVAREFAQATGCPLGRDIVKWAAERSAAAEQAALNSINQEGK